MANRIVAALITAGSLLLATPVAQAHRRPAPGAGRLDGVRLDGIDHVVVTGDTATADITVTTESGTKPPQKTQITRATLLRQDGRWCTAV